MDAEDGTEDGSLLENEETEDAEPEEIKFPELTVDDMLYGYLPDEGYNPSQMEDNDKYLVDTTCTLDNVPEGMEDKNFTYYHGSDPCLKKCIDNKFSTLLGACGTRGHFDQEDYYNLQSYAPH